MIGYHVFHNSYTTRTYTLFRDAHVAHNPHYGFKAYLYASLSNYLSIYLSTYPGLQMDARLGKGAAQHDVRAGHGIA